MSTGFSTPTSPANMKASNADATISIPAINTVDSESIALGYGAVASGESSIAIGYEASASGEKSVAIGPGIKNPISNLVTCFPLTLSAGHLYTQYATPSTVESITSGSTIGPFTDTNGVQSDFDLYIPITLSPTSSEAATATLGLTIYADTSNNVGTWSSPAGGPTIEIMAYVRVPGSAFVTITLTNATAGTATVIQ